MAEVERKFIHRDCKVSAAAKVLNVPRRDLPALLDAKPALLLASFEAVERGLNAAEVVLRQALRKGNARPNSFPQTTLRIDPPSTPHTEEVTNDARSDARNTITFATSSGVPSRFSGSWRKESSCSTASLGGIL